VKTAREIDVLADSTLGAAASLALALPLPPSLAMRNEIVVATFGVVAFSVIVQGLTMPLLLRMLGFLPENSSRYRY
jgi:CPA1 family monovalent cation:H+ antiporter